MRDISIASLFRSYHRDLVRFATRLIGDRCIGEEIAQDVYLKLVGGKVQLSSVASPRAYLFAAARNIAIDNRNRMQAEWARRVDLDDITSVGDTAPSPFEIHYHRQRLKMLAAALNELPSACRTAFFLNRVAGLRHRTIAERLGISVSMVEKHVYRAFVHCRTVLENEENFSGHH